MYMPIHVLQITGDPVGGIRNHVHSILRHLDRRIFVQSYAYSTTAQDKAFLSEIDEIKAQILGVVPMRIPKKPHLVDALNILKLVRYVRSNHVDLIHGHGAKGGLYARIVARLTGVRAVYTPHGGVVHDMFPKTERMLYAAVEKWLGRFTDMFIFESAYSADAYCNLVRKTPPHWVINYNGILSREPMRFVDGNFSAPALSRLDTGAVTNIGVFGTLRAQKGQVFAIRAAAVLLARGVPVRLHLFGDGPDLTRLQEEANSVGSNIVRFHGDVTKVEDWMTRMEFIVIPSLYESFGYVAVEAMMLGKPIVATNVGGLREVLGPDAAILVPPGNPGAIADALGEYMQNPSLAENLARHGHERYLELFTLDRMIGSLAVRYQSLVAGHS